MNKFKKQTAVAIITCNREDFFKKAANSINRDAVDKVYIVNNGAPCKEYPPDVTIIQSNRNPTVVGIGKNTALRQMANDGYEYLFLMEDDTEILDNNIFQYYIECAADSGIWYLNYGIHGGIGGGNVNPDATPNKRATVQYTKHKIDLYKNSLAAFTFIHKKMLKHGGYMDERYLNAAEHLDVERIFSNKKLLPGYWWFPDAFNSFEYIKDQDQNHENSTIRKSETFIHDFKYSWSLFKERHGCFPHEIPDISQEEILDKLFILEKNYARKELL